MGERLNEPTFKAYDHQDIRSITTFGEGGAPLDDSAIREGDRFATPAVETITQPKPATITGIEPGALAAK